jgi:hypothetical protein
MLPSLEARIKAETNKEKKKKRSKRKMSSSSVSRSLCIGFEVLTVVAIKKFLMGYNAV